MNFKTLSWQKARWKRTVILGELRQNASRFTDWNAYRDQAGRSRERLSEDAAGTLGRGREARQMVGLVSAGILSPAF